MSGQGTKATIPRQARKLRPVVRTGLVCAFCGRAWANMVQFEAHAEHRRKYATCERVTCGHVWPNDQNQEQPHMCGLVRDHDGDHRCRVIVGHSGKPCGACSPNTSVCGSPLGASTQDSFVGASELEKP